MKETLREAVTRMTAYPMDEETGKWVVVHFFPHSPMEVYGLFDSEEEARGYAEKHRMADNGGAYQVQSVLNAHYEETFDPVRDGWVDSRGRP
jgi:hypothetical protein